MTDGRCDPESGPRRRSGEGGRTTDDAHPGWALYDLDRLRANLAGIRRRIGPGRACIAAARAAPPGEAVPVYVKVNAGLGWLGVPLAEALPLYESAVRTLDAAAGCTFDTVPRSAEAARIGFATEGESGIPSHPTPFRPAWRGRRVAAY